MDVRNLLADLLAIARNVAPLIVPGAAGAIAAAEAAIRAIDRIRESGVLSGDDDARAAEARADLEARVNAHADATAAALEGEAGGG